MKTPSFIVFAGLIVLAPVVFAQNSVDKIPESAWKAYFPNIDLSVSQSVPSIMPLSPRGETTLPFKVKVEGSIGPTMNNVFTLGSENMRWRDLFVGPHSIKVGNGRGDQAVISYSNTSGTSRLEFDNDDDGDIDVSFTEDGDIEFVGTLKPDNDAGDNGDILRSNGSSSSPTWVDIQTLAWSKTGNSGTDSTSHFVGTTDNKPLVFRTNNTIRASFFSTTGDDNAGAFVPYLDDTYSLGTSTHRWKEMYLGPSSLRIGGFISGSHGGQNPQTVDEATISYSNGVLLIDKGLQTTGNISPSSGGSYSLGTDANRWSDIYLAANSLHIGSSAAEATMSYDDDLLLLHFNTDGDGSPEVTMTGTEGAGKLGIATTPNTSLDVNGDAAFRFSNLTLSNGANTSVNAGASSMVRITGPTAAFEIHGIQGGQDGKVVELYNASGQTMRVFNESSSEATASNRIVTGTGFSFEVRNMCGVQLVYNPTENRWLLINETRNTSSITYTMKTYAAFTAHQTAWTPDFGYVTHRISSSGNVSIYGINSAGVQDGTVILLLNVGGSNITLQNESSNAASASYRIITGTGNNETLAPNKPTTLIYDGTSQRWRIFSGR